MIVHIPKNAQPSSDKMAILLSEMQAMTATTTERQNGFWIGLHSDQWRRLLGGRYRDVLRDAAAMGYIELNDRYSAGRFAKSYRLALPYRIPQTARIDLGRRAAKVPEKIRITSDDAVGLNLARCFESVTIPATVAATGWDLFSVRSIEDRNWYATRCEYRRFHSSFTGLPKRIRSALRIEGKPVVEVDVSNCQPLILGILALQSSSSVNRSTEGQDREPNQPDTPLSICRTVSDLRRYLELCSAGQLYEYLLEKSGHLSLQDWIPIRHRNRFSTDRPLCRTDIKRQYIVLLFSRNATMKQQPLWDIVSREFPTIATFIEQAKQREYQALARNCQRFESGLMIDTVAAELSARFPLVTVHDSIVCPVSRAAEVVDCTKAAFGRYGVNVSVRQERTQRTQDSGRQTT